MPTIRISAGDNGMVLPGKGALTVSQGETITLQAYPNEGYRVKEVLIDGQRKSARRQIVLKSVVEDTEVSVSFCRSMVNSLSKYTLSNLVDHSKPEGSAGRIGITVAFRLKMPADQDPSKVKVSLFNPNNSLFFVLGYDNNVGLGAHTIDPAGPFRREYSTVGSVPGCREYLVSMSVRGATVLSSVVDPDGMPIATMQYCLFKGAGAMLSEGWVVSVDASQEDGRQDYPLDILDFSVVADGKQPLMTINQAEMARGSATATSLEG